jgi:hypothetical protein
MSASNYPPPGNPNPGITQLTGAVSAGPGSGPEVASINGISTTQLAQLGLIPEPVASGFASPCFVVYTAAIDLTTTGTYQVLPAMPYRLDRSTMTWEIESKSGTVSVNPTWQVGSNNSIDDICPSQTPTGFTTGAIHAIVAAPTSFGTNLMYDLTTNGVRIQVTAGATGVTPVLTARFRLQVLGLTPA